MDARPNIKKTRQHICTFCLMILGLVFSVCATGCTEYDQLTITIYGSNLDENNLSVFIYRGITPHSTWGPGRYPDIAVGAFEQRSHIDRTDYSIRDQKLIDLGKDFARKMGGHDVNPDDVSKSVRPYFYRKFIEWFAQYRYPSDSPGYASELIIDGLNLYGPKWSKARETLNLQAASGKYKWWTVGSNGTYVYALAQAGDSVCVNLMDGRESKQPGLSSVMKQYGSEKWFGDSGVYVTSTGDWLVVFPSTFGEYSDGGVAPDSIPIHDG